jgi:hypothetical protein
VEFATRQALDRGMITHRRLTERHVIARSRSRDSYIPRWMMGVKYHRDVAFRTALEQRTAMANREQGLSYVRLRKLVVSNRFLARLMRFTEDEWVLKGEVALNLRLDQYGRTTRDLDLSRRDTKEDGRSSQGRLSRSWRLLHVYCRAHNKARCYA